MTLFSYLAIKHIAIFLLFCEQEKSIYMMKFTTMQLLMNTPLHMYQLVFKKK
jgi:hypothetical protein